MTKRHNTPNNRIVFINQNSGSLMTDIVNVHKQKYAEAVLITGKLFKEQNTELDQYASLDMIIEYNKSSSFQRIYTWLIATVQILFLIWVKYRKDELFIVSNPPFTSLLPLFFSNKFSLLIFDTYPDILISHKILKDNSFLSIYWKRANKKIYNNASNIFTISEGMAENLSQYIDRQKIKVIPNWTDTSFLRPVDKAENPFIKENQIENKFIVLYSGNMGITHDIETIIDVADRLKEEKEILFLFIGDGVKKRKIEKMIEEKGLENCLMLPFQKPDILPFSLGSADIGIVSLDNVSSLYSVPSKTYGLMAIGTTLLCIGNKKSELGKLTEKYQLGEIFDKNAVNEIADFILKIKNDKDLHAFYCLNARKASQNFTQENALFYIK
jgi:glycosyltransferase involved in cell wall biosynthesis